MTTYSGFTVDAHPNGVRLVTFNQPERLNGSPRSSATSSRRSRRRRWTTRCGSSSFTGSGRAFSAGDDISGRRATAAREASCRDPGGHHNAIGTYEGLRMLSQSLNLAVRNLDKLTIAAINGVAIQTGLSLALSCDFRIASTDARLGSATLRFGLLPDEGGQSCSSSTWASEAMDFLMRNRIVDAAEALDLGLVHEVVPPDELMARRWSWPRTGRGPAGRHAPAEALHLQRRRNDFAHALDDIAAKTAISDHHPDAREGATAFREKRPARFNGD